LKSINFLPDVLSLRLTDNMLSTYQWIYLSVKKKWYAYKFASLCQYMLLKWHCTFLSKLISTPILYAILCIFCQIFLASILSYCQYRSKHNNLQCQNKTYISFGAISWLFKGFFQQKNILPVYQVRNKYLDIKRSSDKLKFILNF
jgi:hypothetical protein